MKLLAFVDLHSNTHDLKKIIEMCKKEKPDFLVCAGDISDFGKHMTDIFKTLENLKIPMLIIPGNHETDKEIHELCKKYKFAVDIDRGCYEINDYCFLGYGGGGFSIEDQDFEDLAKKFKKYIKENVNKKIILVVHAPVYKTKTDYLSNLGHQGNKAIRNFIEEIQPKLVLCGHFHDTARTMDRIKQTLIINPGSPGQIIII